MQDAACVLHGYLPGCVTSIFDGVKEVFSSFSGSPIKSLRDEFKILRDNGKEVPNDWEQTLTQAGAGFFTQEGAGSYDMKDKLKRSWSFRKDITFWGKGNSLLMFGAATMFFSASSECTSKENA